MSQRLSQSVCVEADWIWISPNDAPKLFKAPKGNGDSALREIDPAAMATGMTVQVVRTTVRIPLGHPVVVASGTWDPTSPARVDHLKRS